MSDDQKPPRLLLQREAAAKLHCSVGTIARLRREGILAYIPGRPVRISAEDVQKFKDEQIRRELALEPNPRRKSRFAQDATPEQVAEAAEARAKRKLHQRIKWMVLKRRMQVELARKREQEQEEREKTARKRR